MRAASRLSSVYARWSNPPSPCRTWSSSQAGQLGHPGGHPVGPPRRALLGGQRVDDLTRLALRALGPGHALIRPRLHPLRLVTRPDLTRSPEQQQPDRMLARDLPARAGALVRRTAQIDRRLIRLFAAPLTQPPHRPLRTTGLRPLRRTGLGLGCLGGRRIRRQPQHLIHVPHPHSTPSSRHPDPSSIPSTPDTRPARDRTARSSFLSQTLLRTGLTAYDPVAVEGSTVTPVELSGPAGGLSHVTEGRNQQAQALR